MAIFFVISPISDTISPPGPLPLAEPAIGLCMRFPHRAKAKASPYVTFVLANAAEPTPRRKGAETPGDGAATNTQGQENRRGAMDAEISNRSLFSALQ